MKTFCVTVPGSVSEVVEAEYWFLHENGSLIFANASVYGQHYVKAYAAGHWVKVEEEDEVKL